jgi:hypothetical protein
MICSKFAPNLTDSQRTISCLYAIAPANTAYSQPTWQTKLESLFSQGTCGFLVS